MRPVEIGFSQEHPYVLADKKTQYLSDLYKITLADVVIATDVVTMTFTYSIGITNLEFVICLGDDTDSAGNIIGNHKIPYSFRIEEIENRRFNNLYEVTHILKKTTFSKKYNILTFGNKEKIKDYK